MMKLSLDSSSLALARTREVGLEEAIKVTKVLIRLRISCLSWCLKWTPILLQGNLLVNLKVMVASQTCPEGGESGPR